MKPLLAALTFATALSLAPAASAQPLSTTQCTQNYGCVEIDGTGLYVHRDRAGVRNLPEPTCGYFKMGILYPNSTLVVIHTSTYRCYGPIGIAPLWGPWWTQDRNYPTGTQFCGWWSPTFYDKACAGLHA